MACYPLVLLPSNELMILETCSRLVAGHILPGRFQDAPQAQQALVPEVTILNIVSLQAASNALSSGSHAAEPKPARSAEGIFATGRCAPSCSMTSFNMWLGKRKKTQCSREAIAKLNVPTNAALLLQM